MGDFLCCLRFILPRIPQIFTDFIYLRIRAHLCYLWDTPSHPISVFICAICGRFLRTLTYVGDSLCCLGFILPRIPQIFTDFIYSNIRVHLCYPWETPSHPISVFICAICGRFLRTTMGALIPSSTARCGLCADLLPSLSPPRAGVASPRRSGPSRSGRRVVRYAPVRRDVRLRLRSNRTPLCW